MSKLHRRGKRGSGTLAARREQRKRRRQYLAQLRRQAGK